MFTFRSGRRRSRRATESEWSNSTTMSDIHAALRNDNFDQVVECIGRGDWDLNAYNEAVLMRKHELAQLMLKNHPDRRTDKFT